jgi:hypothetical protein
MLYKIQRITKSVEPSSSDIAQIKDNIAQLQDDIVHLSHKVDCRLQSMAAAVEADYQQRMMNISLSYQALTALSARMASPTHETQKVMSSSFSPSPVQKEEEDRSVVTVSTENSSAAAFVAVASSKSPRSIGSPLCPLMTLSGVASAIMERL